MAVVPAGILAAAVPLGVAAAEDLPELIRALVRAQAVLRVAAHARAALPVVVHVQAAHRAVAHAQAA
jgi:hypothetical protein